MKKFGYFFDWQGNGGYEEIKIPRHKFCDTAIESTSSKTIKMKNNRRFKSKKI